MGAAKRLVIVESAKQLFRRFDLVMYLVISHLKVNYQNLVLGYIWWVLNPLLWVLVYWLLVSVIFNRGQPNYPLFLACAILPWRAFATSISQAITSVSGQERLIKQVAFPKSVLPLSVVLSNSVNLLFSILVLIIVALAVYRIPPTVNLVFLPVIVLVQITFTLGVAFFLAAVGIYFVDIQNMMQFILRVWLYLSPSLYGIERIPARFRSVFMLNPFAPIFMSYRDVIMYGQAPALGPLSIAFLIAVGVLVLGFWLFSRQEQKMAKVL